MLRASQLLRSSAYLKGTKGASRGGEETKPEILVVTTDSATLRALEDSLSEIGYGVAGVRDRSQAEDYLNRRTPIMVISDVDLPADSAYHLFRSIKESSDTTSIPCVFLTNRGEFPNKKLGFESGADDYINKPLESTEVKARVEPLLRRGRIGKREELFREEKKPPRAFPEPKDILSEILARKKEAEEPGKERARLSSMDSIKKGLESKPQEEVKAKYGSSRPYVGDTRLESKPQEEVKAKREAEAPKEEDEQAIQDVGAIFQDSVRAVSEWMHLAGQEGLVDIEEVEKISGSLMEKIDGDFFLLSMMTESEEEKNLAHQSVSTAILSLKMGKRLGYPDGKLARLGMVALLHLVGLRKLLEGSGRGTEGSTGEKQQYTKEYPSVGAELLRNSVETYGGQEYAWLLDVITQVEERENGQGVPQGLTGAQIHEYAKVIALAKTYLDFIYPFSPTERIIPSEAIKKIIQMQKDAFSPKIVGAFVKEISLFPVGSWVQLSNGEIGRVVSNDQSHPLRPTVEVWYGSQGEALSSKKELNLVEAPFVMISKPIDEHEIVGRK